MIKKQFGEELWSEMTRFVAKQRLADGGSCRVSLVKPVITPNPAGQTRIMSSSCYFKKLGYDVPKPWNNLRPLASCSSSLTHFSRRYNVCMHVRVHPLQFRVYPPGFSLRAAQDTFKYISRENRQWPNADDFPAPGLL